MNVYRSLSQTSLARISKTISVLLIALLAAGALVAISAPAASAAPVFAALATPPPLSTAASFAVLASSAVTNTGPSVVTGDLGVSPGSAVTGFPPGTVVGTVHATDATALQAQVDATAAYNNAAGQTCSTDLTGQDLGGKTLTPSVYCFDTSAQLTGNLVLNGQGISSSVFIFQMGSTLTTASSATVSFINGANACHVYWQVGSSATLGTSTQFAGNILALASITATTNATSNGGLYALNGAVTLDTNLVNNCTSGPPSCSLTFRGPTATVGDQLFIAGKTVLTLRATGPAAIQSISYRLYPLGGPIPDYKVVQSYTKIFDLGDLEILDRTYVIDCFATDVLEHVGVVQTTTVVLDQHAPKLVIVTTGAGRRTVTLTATDQGSGVATISYRAYLKGATAPTFTTVASDHTSFSLVGPKGTYFVDYYLVDATTNRTATQRATIQVTI